MVEQGRISSYQTVLMLVNLVSATAIMFVPAVASQMAGRDAWLAPVLTGALAGIYQAFLIGAMGRRFPGQTLIQYLQTVLNLWPGKIVGFLYLFFFLHTNSLIIREFGELLASTIMPRTPVALFNVIILLLCAYAVRGGLEVLARTIETTIPFVIFSFLVVIVLAARDMNFNNLLPFLENGLMPIIMASQTPFAWLGEVIVLTMFLPYLVRPEEGKRCAIAAQIILALLIGSNAFVITAVFGPDVARLVFPTFSLAREVSTTFRLDAIAVMVWIISLYGKIALFYYVIVLGTAQLFNLRDYRSIIIPIGVIMAILSILAAENVRELVVHISKFWPIFAYIFEYIIPTGLLFIAAIRFRRA